MSAYTTKPALDQAIEDMRNAFEAGRRESHVAAVITTPASREVITQGEAAAARGLEGLQEMADHIDSLRRRMTLALDAIASACSAWHCQECGSWTTKSIDHGGATYCPRCAPADVYCPF